MLRPLLLLPILAVATCAQVPPPTRNELALAGGDAPVVYTLQLPPAFAVDAPVPLLVLLGDAPADTAAAVAGRGFVVVQTPPRQPAAVGALLAALRQRFRVDQVGMHVGGGGDGATAALRLATEHGCELQTLSLWHCPTLPEGVQPARLRDRRVRLLAGAHGLLEPLRRAGVEATTGTAAAEPDALAAHFTALHAERMLPGAAADVARTLDDFHTAAAQGDEARYFAILPDDAVFLGTDASERWTGAEFRAFALPYFERGPAWTYVPLRRFVTVAAGGSLAWFDEVLDNEAYGACRGSGVLERRDERWVLRQYNLTIPVPNELARDVVARIRAAADRR